MATIRTDFVQGFGCAIDPFDVVTARGRFGRGIPFRRRAFFHFLAKAGDLKDQGIAALGTFFVQDFRFGGDPFDIITALAFLGVPVPNVLGAATKLLASSSFQNIS